MCKCTPSIRTPFCGKLGCEWPKPPGTRTDAMTAKPLTEERVRELREHNVSKADALMTSRGTDSVMGQQFRDVVTLADHWLATQSERGDTRDVVVPRALAARAMVNAAMTGDQDDAEALRRALEGK